MANLQATYMGLALKNPLIAGASSLTSNMESIKKLEESGVGAMVISSLFEETIQLQSYKMEQDMTAHDYRDPEIGEIFPDLEHAGPEEHLMWVRKAVESVDIPVIASLNCIDPDTWVEWAKKLEETGVQGLELNFYAVPIDFDQTAGDIEAYQVETLKKIMGELKVPVSVKLSPFYTSPLNLVQRMDEAGVNGFVLFNRLWHPTVEVDREKMNFPFHLSTSADHGLSMRHVGLLSGSVSGSLCASNGIQTGRDAIALILAGADVFQSVSTFYKKGITHASTMLKEIEEWMEKKGYSSLDDFRGKLNYENSSNKWSFKRAQYVHHLLNSEDYIKLSSAL